jgi:hypothetical protein
MVYVARQGYAYLILPTAEQLRLYLGAELVSQDGLTLATLGFGDRFQSWSVTPITHVRDG